ncbi:MAG: hypothetical protein ABR502_03255 [Chitinophagaceae bacterium]
MVQTDISQLSAECAEWRQILRNYRDEFHEFKKELQNICKTTLSKNQYQDVEHYHNQFHIQLINIHDLKQLIKSHEKQIETQTSGKGKPEGLYRTHEDLLDRFVSLENTLQELRTDFKKFISSTSS